MESAGKPVQRATLVRWSRRSGLSMPVLVVCAGLGADAGACGVAAELGFWGFGGGCGRWWGI